MDRFHFKTRSLDFVRVVLVSSEQKGIRFPISLTPFRSTKPLEFIQYQNRIVRHGRFLMFLIMDIGPGLEFPPKKQQVGRFTPTLFPKKLQT